MARILIVSALISCATPLMAEVVCAPRAELIEKLSAAYGEARQGMGMRGAHSVMEVWASDRTGSWSVIMTYSDGNSCIVAAGEDWTTDPAILAGDPA